MLARLPADCFGCVLECLTFEDVIRGRSSIREFGREALSRAGRLPPHWGAIDLVVYQMRMLSPIADARLLWATFGAWPTYECAAAVEYACDAGRLDKIQWLCAHLRDVIDTEVASQFLGAACGAGQLVIAKWFAEQYECSMDGNALDSACSKGHLEVAQWVAERFDIAEWPAGGVSLSDTFLETCMNGHLDTLQWIADRFRFRTREIALGVARAALRTACSYGHLPIAQWLTARYDLYPEDVIAGANLPSALYCACQSGHLETARWLVARFGLAHVDVRNVYESPFHTACMHGRLDIVEWLIEQFDIDTANANAIIGHPSAALTSACGAGHLELAQWLAKRFDICTENLFRDSPSVLLTACVGGHLPTVKWLVKKFDITVASVRAGDILKRTCRAGQLAVAKWLTERFELVAADACSVNPTHNPDMAEWLIARFGAVPPSS